MKNTSNFIRGTMLKSVCILGIFGVIFCGLAEAATAPPRKPNIIFVLADDIAIGDLGCYGQTKIQTPVLDKVAAEGMRFTQGYSGATVCAPSRTSLMTGLHTGHSPIRANREIQPEGQMPLPEGTYTVAKLLKSNGYATLAAGKWGMGMFDSTGSPLKMGFDNFFGYNCQRHAHSYFPPYLYENDKRFELDGKTYGPELTIDYTLDWIRLHKDEPFFVFYPTTLPHGKYEIDDLGIYKDKEGWTTQQKTYAAMCTRLDTHLGKMLTLLKELNLDDDTIFFFAGDNGSAFAPDSAVSQFFNSNMGLHGYKRSVYEGGTRNACLVRWPKHIPSGVVCDTPWAFWDFLPTCAALIDKPLPENVPTDGVSIVPLLLEGKKPARDTFYWELHEGKATLQGVRYQDWKFVKNGPTRPIELYDLKNDPLERNDLAAAIPDIVKNGEELFRTLRTNDPNWPLKE